MSVLPMEGPFVEAYGFGVCTFFIAVVRGELIWNVVSVQVYSTVLQVVDKPKQAFRPTKYQYEH